jgi:hypothetical protein
MSNLSNLSLKLKKLSYLCPTSTPLSSISIKRCSSQLIQRLVFGVDGWDLNIAFLMDITTYVGMTNFMVALKIPHRIFDLDTNRWGSSPYVIACVIHLRYHLRMRVAFLDLIT